MTPAGTSTNLTSSTDRMTNTHTVIYWISRGKMWLEHIFRKITVHYLVACNVPTALIFTRRYIGGTNGELYSSIEYSDNCFQIMFTIVSAVLVRRKSSAETHQPSFPYPRWIFYVLIHRFYFLHPRVSSPAVDRNVNRTTSRRVKCCTRPRIEAISCLV